MLLDGAPQGPGAHVGVVAALLQEPLHRRVVRRHDRALGRDASCSRRRSGGRQIFARSGRAERDGTRSMSSIRLMNSGEKSRRSSFKTRSSISLLLWTSREPPKPMRDRLTRCFVPMFGRHDDERVLEIDQVAVARRSGCRPPGSGAGGSRCPGAPSRSRRRGSRCRDCGGSAPSAARPPRARRSPGASRSASRRRASPCTPTCRSARGTSGFSNRNSASRRATSVLPTPEGPRKMKEPIGRLGLLTPSRERRIALETPMIAASWPTMRLRSASSMWSSFSASSICERGDGDSGPGGDDLLDVAARDLLGRVASLRGLGLRALDLLLAARSRARAGRRPSRSPCRRSPSSSP